MKGSSGTISLGDMRSTAVFQSNTPVANGSGGFDDNYTTFYTCRGRLRQQNGSRRDENMELVRNRSFELVVRYTTELVIDTNTRILIGTDTYIIVNYEKVDNLPHWYQFIISKNG